MELVTFNHLTFLLLPFDEWPTRVLPDGRCVLPELRRFAPGSGLPSGYRLRSLTLAQYFPNDVSVHVR